MTVHINGSKGKELYYNGVKIKEAYYNGNKVYSSRPLYYCCRSDPYGIGIYLHYYLLEKPTGTGDITVYTKAYSDFSQASYSNELTNRFNARASNVTDSSFYLSSGDTTFVCYYYPSGDLYT